MYMTFTIHITVITEPYTNNNTVLLQTYVLTMMLKMMLTIQLI